MKKYQYTEFREEYGLRRELYKAKENGKVIYQLLNYVIETDTCVLKSESEKTKFITCIDNDIKVFVDGEETFLGKNEVLRLDLNSHITFNGNGEIIELSLDPEYTATMSYFEKLRNLSLFEKESQIIVILKNDRIDNLYFKDPSINFEYDFNEEVNGYIVTVPSL